jgi:lysophospholipase L1-like esterase
MDMAAEQQNLKWLDAKNDIGIEGQGWTETECPYDRFPAKAEAVLTNPAVWNLSKSPTGLCTHFRTNATDITLRWELLDERQTEDPFTRCAYSGFDLYAMEEGAWRWVACTNAFEASRTPTRVIAAGLDGKEREYRLYMPMRNRLLRAEIGVPQENTFEGIPPRNTRPVVIYGTSIVHGAYASRPGLVYTARLGRRLENPVINLGVSGSARMEPEVADLLLELDPAVYVLDAFPNMGIDLVEERLEMFVRKLAGGKPGVPIVVVEDFPRTNAWIMPAKRDIPEKNNRVRRILGHLKDEGVPLFTVRGDELMGTDHEACFDGIHPGDMGYERMAATILPVLQQALDS